MLEYPTFLLYYLSMMDIMLLRGDDIMNKTLCNRLKSARKNLGLSQEYVAKLANCHRTTITAIELGTRKVTTDELVFFSELYGISSDELLYGTQNNTDIKMFARTFSSLCDSDKKEIFNLIEYKQRMKEGKTQYDR
ncbi:helix-turn-helix transcriptional regulator [Sporosalibacterium faouarense]|uniref:helix-turn-helix transcriptional regulator n=1 Tax=Sporosalibacterium faouarense TaxID=516123 RepID=UPI00192AA6A3|nr:helix-turn-helix transcriptional regulator [Sporosalibacterium faouarense]